MADGGQGFFKISLTIFPENDTSELHANSINDMNDQASSVNLDGFSRKRTLYSEGGIISKKSKLTSVNHLIMLCAVPKISESYENLKVLFDLTKINDIPFKFVADFKLLLIINGQQTATSSYPCPYCYISLGQLRARDALSSKNSSATTCSSRSKSSTDKSNEIDRIKLKTYGDIKADYEKYSLAGKKRVMLRTVIVQLILLLLLKMTTCLFCKNVLFLNFMFYRAL